MELKDFQQGVLDTFADYLSVLRSKKENVEKLETVRRENPEVAIPVPDFPTEAWNEFKEEGKLPLARANVPFSVRRDGTGRSVPSICLKIPTAGGKTILAAHAVSQIMGRWIGRNTGFVLWIVPSEAIFRQTIGALRDREHPYRQILDRASAGRVKILSKQDRLDRRDVDHNLCVMVLMLQSANRETKESLRIFRDRGTVLGFTPAEDNVLAHARVLDEVPNLDVYGDRESIGAIIKDSLGNALRIIRPIVVLDEGHKGYSNLALDTLYGFNPEIVLELTATPVDRPRNTPPAYSNWLVDVRGVDLDREEMIKLPIIVKTKGGDDWHDCLRESVEKLDSLQSDADKLHAESSRHIRPICLVQVERTGSDQRDGLRIHAEDVREQLLTLGVSQEQIAIKTAEQNDLNQPENLDLESPTNPVRFIITKQALQEGWDCPFAYVLCSLAPVTSRGAMTQLIGRILRQPETIKTEVESLDQCYVFCYHSNTRDVVEAIKNGLERDGMSDLVDEIRDDGSNGGDSTRVRDEGRAKPFQDISIFLPLVLWSDGDETRPLDYEADILHRINWREISLDGIADKLPKDSDSGGTHTVQIGLVDDPDAEDFLESAEIERQTSVAEFDPTYATRSIVDIVPNPWIAREFISKTLDQLTDAGFSDQQVSSISSLLIGTLREHLIAERDKLAESVFLADVEAGRIQFRLRTDGINWQMPEEIPTARPLNSHRLRRDDGNDVEKNLFEHTYRDDFNGYEQKVACYLDGEQAMKWWYRNVAKAQIGYALQGWRKPKVYPDFIFALAHDDDKDRILVLETKGDHLENLDTAYKKRLMEICTDAFEFEQVRKRGELELVVEDNAKVSCSLIFEENWRTDVGKLIEDHKS